jgi:hypothetical protein
LLGRAQQGGLDRRVIHEDESEGYVFALQSLIFLKNSLPILPAILARLSADDPRFAIEFPYALARHALAWHALEILIKVKADDFYSSYQFHRAAPFLSVPIHSCPGQSAGAFFVTKRGFV